MTLPRLFFVTLLAALACSGPASAGVELQARDVALPAAANARAASAVRVLPARTAPLRFNLVGLHWQGTGTVSFRTATATGRWSAWHAAAPEEEDGPNAGSAERKRLSAWRLGSPYWTDTARRIQYRTSGSVTRLRTFFLWSPEVAVPVSRTALMTTKPAIVTRSGWKANEKIVRGSPSYASRLAFAVVHHTAGSSPATPAKSAAIVRAVQTYHVKSNGWNDIGYNFLVDPFGQIFEGRGGGMTRNVIGAHAEGFNTGSVGIAVLGSYGSTAPTKAAKDALARLIAWRLDLAHVDPTSSLTWTSQGGPKYPAGTAALIKAVNGHGDVGATACPGVKLKGALGSIAAAALALGGPKLFSPSASGSVGGPVRFRARLSTSLPWTVTVKDAAGATVASGTGVGKLVDWTWDSSGHSPGVYRYLMEAEGGVRPASGLVPGEAPLSLQLVPKPSVLTPNADASGDVVRLRVTVSKAATLALRIETEAGDPRGTIASARPLAHGATTIAWRGSIGGSPLPDGRYRLVAVATAGAEQVTRRATLTIDRTLGKLTVTPQLFSPNGDGRRETVAIGFTLTRSAAVRLRILQGTKTVATLLAGSASSGLHTVTWNGKNATDGELRVVAEATTSLGTRSLQRGLMRDTRKPRATILEARKPRGGGVLVRVRLDEPALLVLRFDAETVKRQAGIGIHTFKRTKSSTRVRVYAQDAAANGRTTFARVR